MCWNSSYVCSPSKFWILNFQWIFPVGQWERLWKAIDLSQLKIIWIYFSSDTMILSSIGSMVSRTLTTVGLFFLELKPWTALNKVKYLNDKIVTITDPCEIRKDNFQIFEIFVPLKITFQSLNSRPLLTPANYMEENVRSLKSKQTIPSYDLSWRSKTAFYFDRLGLETWRHLKFRNFLIWKFDMI